MEQPKEIQLINDDKQQSLQVNDSSNADINEIYLYGNDCSSNDTNNESNLKTKEKKKPAFSKHNKWTIEEDIILRRLINELGEDNWKLVSQKMDRRNSRQCRERWKYYLNPNLNIGNWSPEEDQLILSKRQELGPKWTTIVNFFHNRTDAMIKTRYNALIRDQIKKKEEENQSKTDQKSKKTNKSKKSRIPKKIKQIKKHQEKNYYEYFDIKEYNAAEFFENHEEELLEDEKIFENYM